MSENIELINNYLLQNNIKASYYDKIPNPVYIQEKTTTIFIVDNNKNVRECLIDTEDLKLLNTGNSIRGITDNRRCTTYATMYNTKTQRAISIHQIFVTAPEGFVIDHFDRNGLNNKKANLKIVTMSQNMLNKSVFKSNKLGIKNITMLNDYYCINLSKKYKTLEEAVLIRNKIYNVIYDNDYPELNNTENWDNVII